MTEKPKRPVGRPPLEMPELIPDTWENVARALVTAPPKAEDEWDYLKTKGENSE